MMICKNLIVLCLLGGCLAADDTRSSLVVEPRVLALRSEPAEAAPGQRVSFEVLAADGSGAVTDLRLSFCRTPKVLGDNRVVSDACAQRAEQAITGLSASVPADACARFGPNVPAGIRPSDPDLTGGFYQPLRIARGGLAAVAALRLRCPLTDVPLQITREYRERYTPNQTPLLLALTITRAGEQTALDAVPRGTALELHSGWTAASEETYVLYDRAARRLRERTEALRISWYTNAGELADDTTAERAATNHFRTPNEPGRVQLWLVLRDERGAQSFASYELHVQ